MPDESNNEDEHERHEIGYRRPPKNARFKKGRSGNPAGRPKGSRSLKNFLMGALSEKVTVKENGRSKQISKREAAAKQIANKAAMGDLKSLKFVAALLDDRETREEQVNSYSRNQSAGDRLKKKLDDMAARMLASKGLPPEIQ